MRIQPPRSRFALIMVVSLACPAMRLAAEPLAGPALPEIWIKSGAHLVNIPPTWSPVRSNEAGAMWEQDAPWPRVASHVKVALFPPGTIQWAKEEDLQRAFSEMKRRNIELALETGLLTRTDHCQAKNEATGAPGELEQMLVKIQRSGGEVSYIAMDEPYSYGHQHPSGCHEQTAELASNVAANVAIARKIFPKIAIGDIEVVGPSRPFIDELAAWADAYQAAVGEKLAFMQTDIAWSELAMQNLIPLSKAMKARNIPLAIIYNADGSSHTDDSWQKSAEDHIAEIETVLHIHPDIAVFDSWTSNPSHVLPENRPSTLANIALRYLRAPTSLTLQRTADEVSGRLVDQSGAPVLGAKVAIEAIDVSAAIGPTPRSETGTVPDNAATAVVGIRAGLEGSCICDGPAAAIVGGIHYQEQGTNRHEDISPVSLPIDGAPLSTRTLKLTPGMNYAPNLRQFPVTPGKTFTLSTAIAATASADHAGYVTIVFLDASGKEGRRDFVWFEPSHRIVGEATTGPNGGFEMRLPPSVALTLQTIRATYEGDTALRPAWAEQAAAKQNGAPAPALVQPLVNPRQKLIVFAPRKDFWQAYENGASWDDLAKQWPKGSASVNALALTEGQIRSLADDALIRLVHDLNAHHLALQLGILATNWFHEPPCGGGVEGYSERRCIAQYHRNG